MAITRLGGANAITGTLPAANINATSLGNVDVGKVLQVVQATKQDTQTITGSSFVEISGLQVDITPSSTSNKILIITSLSYGATASAYPAFEIRRDDSNIFIASGTQTGSEITFGSHSFNDSIYRLGNAGHHYLDSPNTTSQVSYNIYCSPMRTTSLTIKINTAESISDDNKCLGTSVLTAYEIAG